MKNMKKTLKRGFAMFLSLVMALGIMQTAAIAANWNPGDKITINVRVYDVSTGATYNVGTDSVEKGDQYIQSVNYRIPQLTQFVDADQFGRVQKVVGNWYFPSGDSQPGANVEWSCNVSKVTMTYWVNWFSTGSGTGGNTSDTVNLGGGGSYTFNFTVRYHSNYPSGTNYTVTKKYTVKNYVSTYNFLSSKYPSYSDCQFGGFTPKSSEDTWYTTSACTTESSLISVTSGKTYDLYAGWESVPTPVETLTLTYMDGSTVYRRLTGYSSGDDVLVLDCTTQKNDYTFKGWDTSASATNVVYAAGSTFQIMGNTTLYAVWEENTPAPTTTTLTVRKTVTGDLTANDLPADFSATVTLQNTTTGTSETHVLTKGDLVWTPEISLDAAYSVMVSESNYTLDNYDCSTSGKSATGVAAMGSGAMWFFTITKGATNPVCTVENNYTSKIPTTLLPPTLKMELQRKDADGNWVTVADGSSGITETVIPGETVRYEITVTNPNSASLGKKFVINNLDAALKMNEEDCKGILTVNGKSTQLEPDTLPAQGAYGMEQTWEIPDFGANGVFTITYEALVTGSVSSELSNRVRVADEAEEYQAYSSENTTDVSQPMPSAAITVIVSAPSDDVSDNQSLDADVPSDDSGLGM